MHVVSTNSNSASRLAKVQKGRLKQPLRYVFYGDEGVGKSTLAAHAPAPIWFDVEDGSGRLDVPRYAFRDDVAGHVPATYDEVLAAIDDLTEHDHPYQTLVLDTVDRLEGHLWKWMLDRDSGKSSAMNKAGKKLTSIEEYGYGKGFSMALDQWRALCHRLDLLRLRRRMAIILLAHAQIKTFKNPEGDDFDRYTLRVHEKAGGFLKEWADVTGFCCFEESAGKLDPDARAKGVSTGRRLLKLTRTAAYEAKSRITVPAEVPLDPMDPWAPLARAVDEGTERDTAAITRAIDVEVVRLGGGELAARVKAAVAAAGTDTEALTRYLLELQKRQPTNAGQEGPGHG